MEDASGSPQEQEEEIIDEAAVFATVIENDLTRLKALLQSGISVNSINNRRLTTETLLQFVIHHERVEMFDYILGLKELKIDQTDKLGRTALFYAMMSGKEYFALQLIDKGANIHSRDCTDDTILHIVNSPKLGELAIEKGVDVNAQTSKGETPLYKACEVGNFDLIYMLLYCGALANIPSNNGVLPVALLRIHEEDDTDVLEILLRHTFQSHRNTVSLTTLVEAMKRDSLVFPKLLEITSEVDYDLSVLENFYLMLPNLKTNHFKLFVDKFGYIIQEMIEEYDFSPFMMLIVQGLEFDFHRVKELILILLESHIAAEFVQHSNPSYSTIARLVGKWAAIPRLYVEDEVIKIICLMLSYGLSVTSNDLDQVYFICGYCELFKILLHMEIKMVRGRSKAVSMAELYYDPRRNIDIFFKNCFHHWWLSMDLLSYYNHPKLKEDVDGLIDSIEDEVIEKVRALPPVPSLVELSRNMARKFIVKRYKIKNSMQFYTVVRWLQIPEICKRIVALEKKLY